jgi:hypothetical protein
MSEKKFVLIKTKDKEMWINRDLVTAVSLGDSGVAGWVINICFPHMTLCSELFLKKETAERELESYVKVLNLERT